MKNTSITLLLAIAAIATACSSQKTQVATSPLTGKWQLTKTLADMGDGKAKWTFIDKDSVLITDLKNDGSIAGNAMPGTTKYTITDSAHLAVTIEHNAEPIDYRYKIVEDTLELNPPCREACGMRFVRIK